MAARKRESEGRKSDSGRGSVMACSSPCLAPKIQFLEGVISLYKFITKSVISGSKWPKSENSEICSCLLVLARARPVLARAQSVLARAELVLRPSNPVFGGCHFPL